MRRVLRIGLVSADRLFLRQRHFLGFETADHRVKVVVAVLPPAAFRDVETLVKSDTAGTHGIKPKASRPRADRGYIIVETAKDGADNVRRYSMVVAGRHVFGIRRGAGARECREDLFRPGRTKDVRNGSPAQGSTGRGAARPVALQVDRMGSFKMVRTLAPGAAILLSDAETENDIDAKTFLLINLIGSAPERPDDRGRFARDIACHDSKPARWAYHHVGADPDQWIGRF